LLLFSSAVGWGELANPGISRVQTLGFVPHPSLRHLPVEAPVIVPEQPAPMILKTQLSEQTATKLNN
jgi:hypothetical protein